MLLVVYMYISTYVRWLTIIDVIQMLAIVLLATFSMIGLE